MKDENIIANTTGSLSFLVRSMNSINLTDVASAIKETDENYKIVDGRMQGIPLAELINPGKIVNEEARKQNEIKGNNIQAWWRK